MKQYGLLLLLVQCGALFLGGCSQQTPSNDAAPVQAPAAAPTASIVPIADSKLVVAFGDSLYAGYNLAQSEGFAPALQRALASRGVKAEVINAGVSGETSGGGLQRLSFTLDGFPRKPDLVILGLGANDMLRGLNPQMTRANLDAILTELDRRGIPAMLTGMLASPNMGPDYATAFNRIYPDLAKKHGIPLYPFFLDGVVGHPELQLADGMHPNAKGVELIAGRVAPITAKALKD